MTILMKLVIVALVLISSAISSNGQATFSTSDSVALQAISKAWNQSTFNGTANLPGWNFTGLNGDPWPCFSDVPWKGVLCLQYVDLNSTTTNNPTNVVVVVGLTLDSASIVGTLPKEIGNLQNLVILSLTGNPGLTGPIPAEIANLTNLQTLDLHGNNFTGNIPDLHTLTNLQQLDLSENQLTGQIPNVDWIQWLEAINLSGNQLNATYGPQGFEILPFLITL